LKYIIIIATRENKETSK